jgi:hypothetical protein
MTSVGWSPTLSLEAERAIRTLNRLRVLFARAKRVIGILPTPSSQTYRSDLRELVVVRAFSILESFLTERGDTLLRRELPVPAAPGPMTAFAHQAILGSFRGNFQRGPVAFWRKALGVDIGKFTRSKDLDAYRELRNLVTHALGYVRPGGSPLPESLKSRLLKVAADPATYVGRVPIDDTDVDDVLDLVHEFVIWVDPQAS